MATPVKRWPTRAEWARVDNIARNQEITRLVRDLSRRADVPLDVMRSLLMINDKAHQNIRDLQAVRSKR